MNDAIAKLLFLAQLGSTLYMVGLIWFVQIVHYPLFDGVGRTDFPSYETRHSALTTWVVAPPMLVELATALLLFRFPLAAVPNHYLWIGIMLLGVIWLSTAFIQIPCHNALLEGFDPAIHQRLVVSNWLRTVAWSARGVLVACMAWIALR